MTGLSNSGITVGRREEGRKEKEVGRREEGGGRREEGGGRREAKHDGRTLVFTGVRGVHDVSHVGV